MKKILITGLSGFIGSHLAETFRDRYRIYSHDIDTFDLLDSENVSKYLRNESFDVIIHTANWSNSRIAMNNPLEILTNNLNMFFNLARNYEYFGKLIYYGSGAEYGCHSLLQKANEDYFNTHIPNDAYGLSKFIMAQHACSSTNIFELVIFAVFGPREDWRIRFISNACCRDIFDLPITIMKNVVYDYIYIDDLVRITDWFVNNTLPEHRYNVCSGKQRDLYSLAQIVQKHSDKEKDIIVQEPGMGNEYSGDNSKLLKLIDGLQFTEIENAIASLYQWYLENKKNINKAELSFDVTQK